MSLNRRIVFSTLTLVALAFLSLGLSAQGQTVSNTILCEKH
jgi:hypothetical protein